MSDAIASHTPTQWYILRYIKPDTIRLKQPIAGTINQFNRTENTSLELFAPTIIRVVHREGKLIKVESPLAYQYIFLRGDIQPIRKLCCQRFFCGGAPCLPTVFSALSLGRCEYLFVLYIYTIEILYCVKY